MWEDVGLGDDDSGEGTAGADTPASGALHIEFDTSPEGPAGGAAKPTKRPTQRKQPVRASRRVRAVCGCLRREHSRIAAQALRRANAGDKVFADFVHRAHLMCLLSRALAADKAASDPTLAALVLSVLPPRVAWSLKALHPGAGVTAADMQALCEAFSSVFCILPSRTGAAPPPPPPPGARIPALGDTLRDAVFRAAARKNGDAEELSILFAALCRHWGIPCRTAHALFPQPLKPDGRSLDASEGLSPNPAEWPRGGRRVVVPFGGQPQQQRGAPSLDFFGGAGPSGVRAPPRRPRASDAAPKPVAVFGPPRGGGAAEEPIDLTGDDDDDDVDVEEQPKPKKSKRGRGRGDAELDADLQRAMAASLAGGAPPPPAAKAMPHGGGEKPAARKWTVGDAAWSRARGHIRHWVEVYIGGVPPHGAWIALFPWERVTHSAAKGKAAAPGGLPGTEALDISAVAEVSATAQAKTPLAYVIAASGGGCRDVTRRYARQWSASQGVRTHEPWWMDTLYGLTRLEAAATSSSVDVLAHPWPGAGAAVVAAEDRELKAAVLREPLPLRVADYKAHPLYALERHLTRYQAIWPKEPVGSFNGEEVYPRGAVQELHTKDVWQRLHGRQVLADQLATPAKVIPRRGVAAAAKKAATQPGGGQGRGWGGTSGLGFDVAPVGTSFADDADDYDAAGAGLDPGFGHEEEEEEGDARGGGGGGAISPNGTAAPAPLREDEKTILYGLWQTKAWAQPGAKGGLVPRNEYGNVDLCRGNPVPPGCVHLKGYSRIGLLASKLGIDAVPALTGFERHGGRMVPTLEGVIVAVENQQQLVEAWLQEEEQRNEKQLAKRRVEALKRWRLLVRTFIQKQRLTADGAGPSDPAAGGHDVVCLDSDGEEVTPADTAAPRLPAVERGGAAAEVERM